MSTSRFGSLLETPRRGSLSAARSPISHFIKSKQKDTKATNHCLTSRVRKRKITRRGSIDSSAVNEVLDNYILPMFRGKIPVSSSRSSVYNELILSQKLCKEKEALEKALNKSEDKLKDLEQNYASLNINYNHILKEFLELKSAFHLIGLQYSLEKTETVVKLESHSKYKTMCAQQAQMIDRCHAELNYQKAEFDKLQNTNIGLKHEVSLLKLENNLMGDKLVGLYNALYDFATVKACQDKLVYEFKGFVRSLKMFQEQHEMFQKSYKEVHVEKEFYTYATNNLMEFSRKNEEKMEELNLSYIKEIADLDLMFKETMVVKGSLQNELDLLSSKYVSIVKDFKQLKSKHKGKTDEKVCHQCGQFFYEKDNFNWSCKRHLSIFNGSFYFCCGKDDRNAPGCVVSSHKCNVEDVSDPHEHPLAPPFCSSCCGLDHENSNCPNDPNIRTTRMPENEISRVDLLNKNKRKTFSTEFKNSIRERMLQVITKENWNFTHETEDDPIIPE